MSALTEVAHGRTATRKVFMQPGARITRAYAQPVHTLFRSRGVRWDDPILGAREVTALDSLSPEACGWHNEYAVGGELYLGHLACNREWETEGATTNHRVCTVLPNLSDRERVATGPWITAQVQGLIIPGSQSEPQLVPSGVVAPQADNGVLQFPDLVNSGDHRLSTWHWGTHTGGKTLYRISYPAYGIELTIKIPPSLELAFTPGGDPDLVGVKCRDTGALVFRFQRILPATDSDGRSCRNAYHLHHAADLGNGLHLMRIGTTAAGDAWLAGHAPAWVDIDPTVIAGAHSGGIVSLDPDSWANAYSGGIVFDAYPDAIIAAGAGYDPALPGWADARGYGQYDTSGLGSIASAALMLTPFSIGADGGSVQIDTIDYSTLTTGEWNQTPIRDEVAIIDTGDLSVGVPYRVPLLTSDLVDGNTSFWARNYDFDVLNVDPGGGGPVNKGATFAMDSFIEMIESGMGRFRAGAHMAGRH